MFKKLILPFIIASLLAPFISLAQKKFEMTIPYSNRWEICDTPISSYYRKATLFVGERTYFIGKVNDYYNSHQLQMEGNYSENGDKEGEFIYYYRNGKIERKGNYVKDEMKGIWSFFSPNGRKRMEINCVSNQDFVPLFYVNHLGDTLIKNGTGKFIIDLKEYPHIWNNAGNNSIEFNYLEGECSEGKKEGVWKYFYRHRSGAQATYKGNTLYSRQLYKKGKFLFGDFYIGYSSEREYIERNPISVLSEKEYKISNFDSDFSIDYHKFSRSNVSKFLFNAIKPVMVSKSISYKNNIEDYINCIKYAMALNNMDFYVSPGPPYTKDYWILNETNFIQDYELIPASGQLDISFGISKEGAPININITGNLSDNIIKSLNYYLSILRNLKSNTDSSKVSLKLIVENEEGQLNGERAYNTFISLSTPEFNRSFKKYTIKNSQLIQAKPPVFGEKKDDWQKYINKEIKARIQSQNFDSPIRLMFDYSINEEGNVVDIRSLNRFPVQVDSKENIVYNRSKNKDLEYELMLICMDILKNSPKWKPADLDGKATNYELDYTFFID